MEKHMAAIEECIRALESRTKNYNVTKKDIAKAKDVLKPAEKYVAFRSHQEMNWGYDEKERAAGYFAHVELEKLRSRIAELKGMLALAQDDPVKAREFVSQALQHLKKDGDWLVSQYGKSIQQTSRMRLGVSENSQRTIAYVIVGILIILFLVYTANAPSTDEAPDYCDRAICK